MDFLIRQALPEDLTDAGRITVEAFVGDGFTNPTSTYVELLRDAGRRAREAELLVAVDAHLNDLDCFVPHVASVRPGPQPLAQ
ncbi:hypothetical protein ACIQOV_40740 [Kitasatospora sp. NPDC091257]|uniref:hypothetical protein n=1 Tax=Kitasatospora sp. NPDC091257 TaxID=3364084 RepID=UPI003824D6AF